MSPFLVLGVSGGTFFIVFYMEISVSINSVDPDQMLHFAASNLGLHCLNNTPKQVSCLERINLSVLFALAVV